MSFIASVPAEASLKLIITVHSFGLIKRILEEEIGSTGGGALMGFAGYGYRTAASISSIIPPTISLTTRPILVLSVE